MTADEPGGPARHGLGPPKRSPSRVTAIRSGVRERDVERRAPIPPSTSTNGASNRVSSRSSDGCDGAHARCEAARARRDATAESARRRPAPATSINADASAALRRSTAAARPRRRRRPRSPAAPRRARRPPRPRRRRRSRCDRRAGRSRRRSTAASPADGARLVERERERLGARPPARRLGSSRRATRRRRCCTASSAARNARRLVGELGRDRRAARRPRRAASAAARSTSSASARSGSSVAQLGVDRGELVAHLREVARDRVDACVGLVDVALRVGQLGLGFAAHATAGSSPAANADSLAARERGGLRARPPRPRRAPAPSASTSASTASSCSRRARRFGDERLDDAFVGDRRELALEPAAPLGDEVREPAAALAQRLGAREQVGDVVVARHRERALGVEHRRRRARAAARARPAPRCASSRRASTRAARDRLQRSISRPARCRRIARSSATMPSWRRAASAWRSSGRSWRRTSRSRSVSRRRLPSVASSRRSRLLLALAELEDARRLPR